MVCGAVLESGDDVAAFALMLTSNRSGLDAVPPVLYKPKTPEINPILRVTIDISRSN